MMTVGAAPRVRPSQHAQCCRRLQGADRCRGDEPTISIRASTPNRSPDSLQRGYEWE